MKKLVDIDKSNTRKKFWNIMGFGFIGNGFYLSKHSSLNCGCALCKSVTKHRRQENKSNRLSNKRQLVNELKIIERDDYELTRLIEPEYYNEVLNFASWDY